MGTIVGRLRELAAEIDAVLAPTPEALHGEDWYRTFVRDRDALTEAAAHIERLEAEARRYRWLKDHWDTVPLQGHTDADDLDTILDGAQADEAIDADPFAQRGGG